MERPSCAQALNGENADEIRQRHRGAGPQIIQKVGGSMYQQGGPRRRRAARRPGRRQAGPVRRQQTGPMGGDARRRCGRRRVPQRLTDIPDVNRSNLFNLWHNEIITKF